MMNMQVPFLDLRAQHEPLMTELVDAFSPRYPELSPEQIGFVVNTLKDCLRR